MFPGLLATFKPPHPRLTDVVRGSVSGPALAYPTFEDYARHQARTEFWSAFRRYRLRVEAEAQLAYERMVKADDRPA